MRGLKFVFAGIGFILFCMASIFLMQYYKDINSDSREFWNTMATFSPFVGIILIIVGLATKEQ